MTVERGKKYFLLVSLNWDIIAWSCQQPPSQVYEEVHGQGRSFEAGKMGLLRRSKQMRNRINS
jgi:hypothetical protein